MIESSTWYYTLSTIAQTLGAVLALGGAFVTFTLHRITERIKVNKEGIFTILSENQPNSEKSYSYHNSSDEELVRGLEKVKKEELSQSELELKERFETDVRNKNGILRKFAFSLTILSTVIITSIMLLPLQKLFGIYDSSVLTVVLGATFVSVYVQTRIIWFLIYK